MQYSGDIATIQQRLAETSDLYRRRLAVLDALDARPGERILEVGCGAGALLPAIASAVGSSGRVGGIDISADQIAVARRRCADQPNIETAVRDVRQLPYGSNSFDAVVAVQVIEYLDNPRQALTELRRIATDRARAVILATNWDAVFWNTTADDLTRKVIAAPARSYQDRWGNTTCERRDADGQQFGGDGRSIAKFLDLRLCAPFAESLWVEGKLPLAIKQLVGDLAHARGIFEDHSIRALEIEESRRGGWVPSGPEHHGHSAFGQEIKRAHHVIACGDLMIDVLDARSIRRKQCDRVMDLVDAQQRRIADAVAHPGVADLGPKSFITPCVGGAEPDVAESSDPGVPLSVIAPAAGGGPPNELDLVAGGILETDKASHVAQFGFLRRTQADAMTELFELRSRGVQIGAIDNLECDSLIGGRAGEIAQRVFPLVGLEIDGVPRSVRDFEAQIIRCESRCAIEIRGAETDVADVLQFDHGADLSGFARSRRR
jgi:SAM-dependent methyltransferase